MKRVFFHIHIWKTGGTSFLNICRQNFGKGFHRDIMLVQNWFLSLEQLRWLLDYHDWLRCYSCHMLCGELPYDMAGTEVVGIAFVRDPVKRFISSYNFQIAEGYRGGIAKQNSFEAFVQKALVDTFNPFWRNGQTYVLGGASSKNSLEKINENVAQGKLILLPTERFDESCILLERLFPVEFKDNSYVRYNTSKRNETVTDSQKAAIAQFMEQDFELLEMANNYLNAALERVFSSAEERQDYLDNFRARCEAKRRKNRFRRIPSVLARNLMGLLPAGANK